MTPRWCRLAYLSVCGLAACTGELTSSACPPAQIDQRLHGCSSLPSSCSGVEPTGSAHQQGVLDEGREEVEREELCKAAHLWAAQGAGVYCGPRAAARNKSAGCLCQGSARAATRTACCCTMQSTMCIPIPDFPTHLVHKTTVDVLEGTGAGDGGPVKLHAHPAGGVDQLGCVSAAAEQWCGGGCAAAAESHQLSTRQCPLTACPPRR